jgi:hypothetical protein
MTNEQKSFANEIVAYFKTQNGGPLTTKQLDTAILQKNIIGHSALKPVLSILVFKEILFFQPTKHTSAGMVIEQEHYILTDKGWTYESYDKILQDEKHKRDLEDALITSSIASNKSVRYVNKLFWLTAIFAFASAVGTVGTFILELNKSQQPTSPNTVSIQKDTAKTVQVQLGHLSVPTKK